MFIGHFAVALGAKRAAPAPSLGTYFLAAQFPDLLWPVLCLLGIEHLKIDPGNTAFTPLSFTDYPFSHSLLTNLCWATGAALLYLALRRDRAGSVMIWLAVISHWVLDALTHRPDLPLLPGGAARIGLGLWNSVAGTMVVEIALYAAGVYLYVRSTRARDRTGSVALWVLVFFLLLTYVVNSRGGAPPSTEIVSWLALSLWPVVLWAYWVDRHREKRT